MSRRRSLSRPSDAEDLFHVKSAPIHDDGQGKGEIFVQAYEALLQYGDGGTMKDLIPWKGRTAKGQDAEMVTDRFDAIHLLATLPEPADEEEPVTPSGMSDLASDSEDIFFMDSQEAHEYERKKRMQHWENQRQARMQAMSYAKEEMEASSADQRTEMSEKLTDEQLNLMKRTAKALHGAGNPTLLEMKILANHGADSRFSFLRKGKEQRWGDVWARLRKGEAVIIGNDTKPPTKPKTLVDYGSDSSTEEKEEDKEADATQAKKKRKLDLVKEWKRKRQEGS